jgi:hypothetical protein
MGGDAVQVAVQKALRLHEKADDCLFRGDATGGANGRRILRECRRLRIEASAVLEKAGAWDAYRAVKRPPPDQEARRKWHEKNKADQLKLNEAAMRKMEG